MRSSDDSKHGDAHFADFFDPDTTVRTDVTPVTRLVREFLVGREEHDTSHHRDDSVWHASTLNREWCPRQQVIRRMTPYEMRMPSFAGPDSQLIFDVGHAMHAWWQNSYLGPMGVLWGRWVCLHCGHTFVGFGTQRCPACGVGIEDEQYTARGMVYEEPTVVFPMRFKWALGHTDGIGFDKRWSVFEFKTMNPFQWAKLDGPLPNHVDQAMMYLHAIREWPDWFRQAYKTSFPFDPEDLSVFRVIYIDKSTGKPQEFVLDYDPSHVAPIIDNMAQANRALELYVEGELDRSLPARCAECSVLSDKKAKGCPFAQFCFQSETLGDIVEMYDGQYVEIAARTSLIA